MGAGAASIGLWPLLDIRRMDRTPAVYWPEPNLVLDPEPDDGPVLVTVTYTVAPPRQQVFLDAMTNVRRSRLRTGATRWELDRDGELPDRFVESFTVASWEEHMRQHAGRLTGTDRAAQAEANRYSDPAPKASHLIPARSAQAPGPISGDQTLSSTSR
jgi:hypothetical protein